MKTDELYYKKDYWQEYEDEEGNIYYVHETSGETAWEVPEGAMIFIESRNQTVSKEEYLNFRNSSEAGSKNKQHVGGEEEKKEGVLASSTWTELLDESSGQKMYYYNQETGESLWEKPAELLAMANAAEDDFTLGFEVPRVVSRKDADGGAAVLFGRRRAAAAAAPNAAAAAADEFQVPKLERINVLEPLSQPEPYRQRFTRQEADEVDWSTFATFYAFAEAVPHADPVAVEAHPAPRRHRARRPRITFPRDITKWNESKKDTFYAYPQTYQGTNEFHVDWSSGPDRYMISQDGLPRMGWKRQFQFYAYGASKYHVLEKVLDMATARPGERPGYKIVKGHYIPAEPGWRCRFGFYGLDDPAPGANLYHVQDQEEPFYRTRIGLERATHWGWKDRFSFYAFDVPIHGTSKVSVHYMMRSTDSEDVYPDQHRITLGLPSGAWEHLFDFYAFPAPSVQLLLEEGGGKYY
eukprot:CAMPEP_0194558266 /NCGR_PEP_ID=MMETSP0292-20121207/242_1 /TAXON_ID=39354 /ORGANISM="Heterosigma akashiwo, Strain CCMP2393" /LENGTH=465 /DNA_ID=CAMNT_0039405865 /DNA_START=66 /DNA_END=1463 /DNA_ORIENTATION=-